MKATNSETLQFEIPKEIDKFLNYMENIKSASPLTIKNYRLDLRQCFFDDNKSQFHRPRTSEEIMGLIRTAFNNWSTLSLASRNRKAATLKSFLGYLYLEKKIDSDLSLKVTCPKVPKKIPHFISVDEVLAVMNTFTKDTAKTAPEQVLFYLLYGGGLRVSEACQLRWKDLLSNGALKVRGKGNKERLIVAPEIVRQTLHEWKNHQPDSEFVFGNKELNPRTAYQMIRNLGARAGLLSPLHPHALRHSFATHMLSSGANLRTLQELLGHESLTATEKYTHLGIDQLARTMEKLHPLGSKK